MNSALAAHYYDFMSLWVCVCEKLVSCLTFAHKTRCVNKRLCIHGIAVTSNRFASFRIPFAAFEFQLSFVCRLFDCRVPTMPPVNRIESQKFRSRTHCYRFDLFVVIQVLSIACTFGSNYRCLDWHRSKWQHIAHTTQMPANHRCGNSVQYLLNRIAIKSAFKRDVFMIFELEIASHSRAPNRNRVHSALKPPHRHIPEDDEHNCINHAKCETCSGKIKFSAHSTKPMISWMCTIFVYSIQSLRK